MTTNRRGGKPTFNRRFHCLDIGVHFIDPYNIVMETQNATDEKEARNQFVTYLSNPQRWNRYHYALNNPLLYTDPNGEDVTIYYRPARKGELTDFGHFFIYVKNDETGESAYFDYYVEGGFTHLGRVNQERIDAHASLTIETNSEQEQAILNGIKEMQESAPNYDIGLRSTLTFCQSQCTTQSANILERGGINLGNPILPSTAWYNAVTRYAPHLVQDRIIERDSRNRVFDRVRTIPSEIGGRYGRDPRGQARQVDRNATNNRDLRFRDGRRQN